MSANYTVLVVAATPGLRRNLARSVSAAGYRPVVVVSFPAAKRYLQSHPQPALVISEIKLAEHNGLHLAVRGQAVGFPAIVVGEPAFKHDAEQIGATWVSPDDVPSDRMQAAIAQSIDLTHYAGGPLTWDDDSLVRAATANDAGVPLARRTLH